MSGSHLITRKDSIARREYAAVHTWLRHHARKTGECEECGKVARTQWALKPGKRYAKLREHFRELCVSCHLRQDRGGTLTHCRNGHERKRFQRRYRDGKSHCYLCVIERNRGARPGSLRRLPRPLPRGRARKDSRTQT